MTALSPNALALLDFLCDMHSRRIRVKSLKRFADAARRDRLQEAGLLFAGTCEPTPWAMADWTERQRTRSEAANASVAVDEPPAPMAAAEGGGDARCGAPSPEAETQELPDEPVAGAAGIFPFDQPPLASDAPAKAKRTYLRKAKAPFGDRRYAANRKKSEGATEPAALPVEPASSIVPDARARSVDIKVNARRDPTQKPETPLMDLRERFVTRSFLRVAQVNRGIEEAAAERLNAGKKPRNSIEGAKMAEIERRRADEFRLLDPVEQAKTVIRIAGWNCFAAVIYGGPLEHYYIGNRMVPEAELLTFAERLRTTRRRRA